MTQIVCPHCGGIVDSRIQKVRRARPDAENIRLRKQDERDRIQERLLRARALGFEVDFGAFYSARRPDYQFLHDLWFEWNYERQQAGKTYVNFRDFDPWTLHDDAQSLVSRVAGSNAEYEIQAGRMFGWRKGA